MNDILDVLADVAGLGQRRRIGNRKWNVEQTCERLRQQRLTAARRTDEQHVAFRKLDFVLLDTGIQTFVMIVDRDGQDLLGLLLTNDVFVEDLIDLHGDAQLAARAARRLLLNFLTNDVVTQLDAFIANKNGRACNQFAYFVLAFPTKRAIQQSVAVALGVLAIAHSTGPRQKLNSTGVNPRRRHFRVSKALHQ